MGMNIVSISVIADMLKRLPSLYNKAVGSNVTKLLTLPATELQSLQETFDKIKLWRDIDEAEGATLDRIGKIVQEARGDRDDVEYRRWIKTRIASNISGGDIETINQVAAVYFGERFSHVSEMHSLAAEYREPAGVRVHLFPGPDISVDEDRGLRRIVAAGVSLRLAIIPANPKCGTFKCGTFPYPSYG